MKTIFNLIFVACCLQTDVGAGTLFYDNANEPFNPLAIQALSTTNSAITNSFGGNTPFGLPSGLATDTNGFLYAAYSSTNIIVQYTPLGQSIFTMGVTNPGALAFDSAGNLYSANADGSISRITPSKNISLYATLPSVANGLCFDENGSLYANLGTNGIEKISTNGNAAQFAVLPGIYANSLGMMIDSNGNLFVGTVSAQDDGNLWFLEINALSLGGIISTNSIYKVVSDAPSFDPPITDGSGTFYYLYSDVIEGGVYHISSWGNNQINASQGGYNDSHGYLAYSPYDILLTDTPTAPVILRQPQSETVGAGSAAVFAVYAAVAPFTYQWFFDGTNPISGATNASLTITNVQVQQSGTYTVVVSNAVGSTNSQPASLNVLPEVAINLVPAISIYGGVGYSYNVQYINAIGPTNAPWITLATVTLTNSPQFYFDATAIGQPARFYRVMQTP